MAEPTTATPRARSRKAAQPRTDTTPQPGTPQDTQPEAKRQPAKLSQPRTAASGQPDAAKSGQPGTAAQNAAQPRTDTAAQPGSNARMPAKPDGAAILDECEAFVRRFWIAPSDSAYTAFTLWAAHTHGMPAFTRTPRLAITGDEPGIGKTRGLDLLALLANNAGIELDPTGPAFAAKMSSGENTALIDETDTIWGKNGGGSGAMRTLRSILNSGYRRGARITRKKGREWESIYVFGPVAFAGMGSLPDTIMDRSIPIRMQRRQPHQKIETYMPRTHEAIGKAIGESVGQWIRSVMFELTNSWPEMPEGIADRKSEVAESLLAVADAAGGHWPKDARTAIKELLLETKANAGPSPAERVMRDLRVIWPDGKPRVSTTDLLIALFNLDGAPWSTIWDPMSASRELAALLATKGIAPRKVKLGAVALQGYRKEDFGITWSAIDASDRAKAEAEAKAEADRLARRETRGADDTSALDELEDDE